MDIPELIRQITSYKWQLGIEMLRENCETFYVVYKSQDGWKYTVETTSEENVYLLKTFYKEILKHTEIWKLGEDFSLE